IMRDVGADHEEAGIAQLRVHPAALRPAMDRDVLADDAVVADEDRARLALETQVLRIAPYGCERMDARVGTNRGLARQDNMRPDGGVRPHDDIGPDDGVGPDRRAFAEARAVLHDRGRMDRGAHTAASPITALTS